MGTLRVVDETIRGRRVLVRGDIDVPEGDFTRLEAIKPTIDFLLQNGNTVVLGGHLGRPGGKVEEKFSVRKVAEWFGFAGEGPELIDSRLLGFRIDDNFVVLENLRFFPEEENNDAGFARELANLAEVYVNEAFATCERAHASIVGVPQLLPCFAGFRLAKEWEVLSKVIKCPDRPLVVVVGGAKLETKLPVISRMATVADKVIVGGRLLTELETLDLAHRERIEKLELSCEGEDVTLNSIEKVRDWIMGAQTIVWNGPVGRIESGATMGSKRLVKVILENKRAYKIVGGGDTVGFLNKEGLSAGFDWISVGGGSMLKLLAGETLPGVEVLLR